MSYQTLINRDLASRIGTREMRSGYLRPAYWLFIGLLGIFTILVLLGINPEQAAATRQLPLQITGVEAYSGNDSPLQTVISGPVAGDAAITPDVIPDPYPDSEDAQWHTITIKSGDNLADIFSREGISPQQLYKIMNLGGAAHNLKKIYPGQTLRVLTDNESGLLKLEYQID
ncbi:MAG: LysM-like peptidoglycan-binding domain-containing protein [Gammaproteobacteria bacterium]